MSHPRWQRGAERAESLKILNEQRRLELAKRRGELIEVAVAGAMWRDSVVRARAEPGDEAAERC